MTTYLLTPLTLQKVCKVLILHINTDDHCVFLFVPVGMYVLTLWYTHSELLWFIFCLQRVWNITPCCNFILADICFHFPAISTIDNWSSFWSPLNRYFQQIVYLFLMQICHHFIYNLTHMLDVYLYGTRGAALPCMYRRTFATWIVVSYQFRSEQEWLWWEIFSMIKKMWLYKPAPPCLCNRLILTQHPLSILLLPYSHQFWMMCTSHSPPYEFCSHYINGLVATSGSHFSLVDIPPSFQVSWYHHSIWPLQHSRPGATREWVWE